MHIGTGRRSENLQDVTQFAHNIRVARQYNHYPIGLSISTIVVHDAHIMAVITLHNNM